MTTGAGGAPTLECLPGQAPYAGPLCGSSGLPCKLLTDEVLPNPPAFRNHIPGIALDGSCAPHFVFSVAEGGYHGFYAKRDGLASYSVEETPFPVATGGIAVTGKDDVVVAVDDGAFGVSFFLRTPGGWDAGVKLPGQFHAGATGVDEDAAGVVHTANCDSNGSLHYAKYDPSQALSLDPLNDMGSVRVAIAVTPGGDAHTAYWHSLPGIGWVLRWQAPSAALSEDVLQLGSGGLGSANQLHSIAVGPSAAPGETIGVPHILMVRPIPGQPSFSEVARATRTAPGKWTIVTLDQENFASAQVCDVPPNSAGDTCNYDYDEIIPMGIVASQGGAVRAVYNKVHHKGTRVAQCMMQPNICFWTQGADSTTGQVLVASDNGDSTSVETSVVAENFIVVGAMVKLDTIGHIHVAAYDTKPASSGMTVRYLAIGH